jgi:hypothetical protein
MAISGWPYFSHRRFEPSPRTWPKPSYLPVFSAITVSAWALPKVSGMPSVSASVMTPISNSSMAAASVPPKEIGSMPCSFIR